MKLKTTYKRDTGQVNGLEIEVFEIPKPCRNYAYPEESIVIENIKYAVVLLVLRHEKETEFLLRVEANNENNIAIHNKIILAKEVSDQNNYIEYNVLISNTGKNEIFKIPSFPHNNEEYLEKNNIVYKIKSIVYKDGGEISISVKEPENISDFFRRWGYEGILTNL